MLALEVNQLSKAYGGNTVLAGVDITLNAGEVLCILGPNGAGKTSLISIILGLVKADNGICILHSSHAEHTIKALLLADDKVRQLEVRPVPLEQAFLQLTQNKTTNKEKDA